MYNERKLSMLALSLIFPGASSLFHEIYSHFGNCCEMLENLANDKKTNLPDFLKQRVMSFDINYAKDIYTYCENNGIHIVTLECGEYPQMLKEIDCPPAVLYCIGNLSALNVQKSAAVVGARKACDYSVKIAEIFSRSLAENGTSVISGFANGIDTAAHKACLNSGGITVAVLGCGIDCDYPKGKSDLKRLIAQNGAVISEYPPLTRPAPENFRIRNRIIAGLSKAILVVQAGRKSGSLNTVSHGLEQGKDIYVVPPRDILSPDYVGQSLLLKDGAQAVYSPHDILINI